MNTAHNHYSHYQCDTVALFREAMANAGLVYSGEIIADGSLQRFTADGDKANKKNSWFILFDDNLPAGTFGCWKRGISGTWSAKQKRHYTPQERLQQRQRMELIRQQREQEQRQREQEAKQKAASLWRAASKLENSEQHFYTQQKNVPPYGVRVLHGVLLVPVFNAAGELVGLQRIFKNQDGETIKRFLMGTPTKSHYCSLGSKPVDLLCIGEGWATMASVHEATGLPCVVAFSANNLEPVARVMREKYPHAKIVICADDDSETETKHGRNVGIEAAQSAALAVGGFVAIPKKQEKTGAKQ